MSTKKRKNRIRQKRSGYWKKKQNKREKRKRIEDRKTILPKTPRHLLQ